MATYLPGVTDIIPETPLFRPDFNFYNSMLQKKTAQYDQGFAKINNSYNAVLNAPLTNQQNISVRDGYIEESKQKLDQLAGSDLSLLENANAAEGIFAPFWEDDLIVQDAALTRSYAAEAQKGLAMRDSKDEKIRAGYSETAMQDIANGKKKLASAGRDPAAFAKLEARRFVPFQDIPEYFNKALKDAGYKWESTSPGEGKSAPYLVTINGGQRAQIDLATFASGMVGSQLQDQLRVMGRVEQEGRVEQAKLENPTFNDEQAIHAVAKDFVKEYRGSLEKSLSSIDSQSAQVTTKIAALEKQVGGMNTDQQVEYLQLLSQQKALTNGRESQQEEYDKVKTDDAEKAAETIELITGNPGHYFMSMARNNAVNNWAKAQASNSGQKYAINPAWVEFNNVSKDQASLELEYKKLEQVIRVNDWNENPTNPDNQPKGSTTTTNADGTTTTTTASGVDDPGNFLGTDSANISKSQKVDMFRAQQARNSQIAHESVFSIEGLGRVVMNLGVNHQQLVTMFSAVNKDRENTDYKYSAEERQASDEISKKLEHATGMKIKGPGGLRNAMLAYSTKFFKENKADLTPELEQSLQNYMTGSNAMNEYNANERIYQNLIDKDISTTTDPEAKVLYVSKENGKKGLIASSDIEKDFSQKSYDFMVGGVGGIGSTKKTYTSAELAKLYLEGKIEKNNIRGNYTINGQVANSESNPGSMGATWSTPGFDDFAALSSKYGDSTRIAEILKERKEAVADRMPQFENKTGQMGSIVEYNINNKKVMETGIRLAKEIGLPSNRDGSVYQNGVEVKDPATIASISALSSLGEADLEKMFSNVHYKTRGINGKRSIILFPAPQSDADKKATIGGVDMTVLGSGPIEIPISDNAKGTTLNKLAYSSGMYIHEGILQGKTFKSDPILEAAGYSYKIIPDNTKNPTKAYVIMERKVIDPKTGTWSDKPVITEKTIDFYGPNKKDPDQLVSEMNRFFNLHNRESRANQELNKQTNPGSLNKTAEELKAIFNQSNK